MTITSSSPTPVATSLPTAEKQAPTAYKRIYEDGNLMISADFDLADVNNQDPYKNVTIDTGNQNDRIHLRLGTDQKLIADINGKSYPLNLESQPLYKVRINTNGGADRVTIDENVKNNLEINTGEGNDYFKGGGGLATVHLGDGDDQAYLGIGGSLYGENGNDYLVGGSGWRNRLMGGSGNNIMTSAKVGDADQNTYMRGSGDNDTMALLSGGFSIFSGTGQSSITTEGKGDIWVGKGLNLINTTSQAVLHGTKDTDVVNRTNGPDSEKT